MGLSQAGYTFLTNLTGGDDLQGMVAAQLRQLGGERVYQAAAEGAELRVIGDGIEGEDDQSGGMFSTDVLRRGRRSLAGTATQTTSEEKGSAHDEHDRDNHGRSKSAVLADAGSQRRAFRLSAFLDAAQVVQESSGAGVRSEERRVGRESR